MQAEELRRHLLQLVGLVEDDDLVGRQDLGLGPRFPHQPLDPLEHRPRSKGRVPVGGPQHCRHQLLARYFPQAACPVFHQQRRIDQQRQIAVGAVVVVVEGQLLLAVGRVLGRVHVDHHPHHRLAPMPPDEVLRQELRQPQQFLLGDPVLQARERGLAAQRRPALGKPTDRRLEERVAAQRRGVVGVLVAAGNLIDALAQQL